MTFAGSQAFTSSAASSAGRIEQLRQQLRAAETTSFGEGGALLALGIPAIDEALGGGLIRGVLHEIAAAREPESAAATGFALALAARTASLRGAPKACERNGACEEIPGLTARSVRSLPRLRGRVGEGEGRQESSCLPPPCPSPASGGGNAGADGPSSAAISHGTRCVDANGVCFGRSVVWIAEDLSRAENGALYGPGLDAAGIAPEQLITVAAARGRDVLWAMEEALRCRAVGVAIGEVRARDIDQVATRRLSLAAAAGNALGLFLRTAPNDDPSAAATRWIIGAAPSASPAGRGRGIGSPRLTARLVRNRRGQLGTWIVEWNSVEQRFQLATDSEPLAQATFDRSHCAAVA